MKYSDVGVVGSDERFTWSVSEYHATVKPDVRVRVSGNVLDFHLSLAMTYDPNTRFSGEWWFKLNEDVKNVSEGYER